MRVFLVFNLSAETLEPDLLRIYLNEEDAIYYGKEVADEDDLEFGYNVWVEDWEVR